MIPNQQNLGTWKHPAPGGWCDVATLQWWPGDTLNSILTYKMLIISIHRRIMIIHLSAVEPNIASVFKSPFYSPLTPERNIPQCRISASANCMNILCSLLAETCFLLWMKWDQTNSKVANKPKLMYWKDVIQRLCRGKSWSGRYVLLIPHLRNSISHLNV